LLRLLFFILLFIAHSGYAAFPKVLSLKEAILLSVRENPNVQQAQLNHVLAKYDLDLMHWQFKPHYSLSANATTSRNYSVDQAGYVTQNTTGVNLGASWLSPIGTQVTVASSNNRSDHYNPGLSLQIMQPLMRGFGRPIVEAELYNAMEGEYISRLGVEESLRVTVTTVINSYLDVIAAKKNLNVDTDALARAEHSVEQTKIFIQAGSKAGVELVTVEADVASAKTRIEMDKNAVLQARYALLTAIGLDPNTVVEFDSIEVQALIKKYSVPSLEVTKRDALRNDIQYQTDQLTIQGSKKRSLATAEDQTRWQLNLTANAATGEGTGGGDDNAGINSLINGVNQTNSIGLELKIPIDDRSAKNAVNIAKVALREAEIALQQEKWTKETNAITAWNNIDSAKRTVYFAEEAEKLQQKTWNISFQKYEHGLIDSLQLQSAQQQLISSQQALNISQINYLKALVNLDQMRGATLKTWGVEVRYE